MSKPFFRFTSVNVETSKPVPDFTFSRSIQTLPSSPHSHRLGLLHQSYEAGLSSPPYRKSEAYRAGGERWKRVITMGYEFFAWADILQLLEENILLRETKARKTWDDTLQREYVVRKREDKARQMAKNLKKEKQKLLYLYWVVTFVILSAWFG